MEEQKDMAVINRLSRAIGHLGAVKTMVENGRDSRDVLIQLAAVRAEVINLSKIIVSNYIDSYLVDAVEKNDEEVLEELRLAIKQLL